MYNRMSPRPPLIVIGTYIDLPIASPDDPTTRLPLSPSALHDLSYIYDQTIIISHTQCRCQYIYIYT